MYGKGIQLNYLAYDEYTRKHEWVYGIRTYNVVKFDEELHTSDFGINTAPQWFREVKTDPRRIDLQALGLKVAAFFRKNPDLRRERFGIGGLSLDDM